MDKTLFWYDLETFGLDYKTSRISQFAGVRTDMDFNIIDAPIVHYCQPSPEFLPSAGAALVTKISPQTALQQGISERDLCQIIMREFATPNTCVLGFNNLRFDEEFIRYALFRNFYDPYARESQNGCSRFDIIDVVRMTRALRPEGINWSMVAGKPSNRLELLTASNNISHQGAHDALADVYATIEVAKLIASKQPKLWQYCFAAHNKYEVLKRINLESHEPLVHISGMFGSERLATALVVPITSNPKNNNAIIVADLNDDPQELINADAHELARRIFTKQAELPATSPRINLKNIFTNKCPQVAPLSIMTADIAARLGIDMARQLEHAKILQRELGKNSALVDKICAAFSEQQFAPSADPEQQLYDGFIDNSDKREFAKINNCAAANLGSLQPNFRDARLQAIWLRYRARNCPAALSNDELNYWHELRRARLLTGADGFMSYQQFTAECQQCASDYANEPSAMQILHDLQAYAQGIMQDLNSTTAAIGSLS